MQETNLKISIRLSPKVISKFKKIIWQKSQKVTLYDSGVPLVVESGIEDYENINDFVDKILSMIKSNQTSFDTENEDASFSSE